MMLPDTTPDFDTVEATAAFVDLAGYSILTEICGDHEAAQLAAVRLEQAHLEALDATVRLHLAVQLDRLVEDVEGAILPPAYDLAPADEQTSISHGFLLGIG